MLTRLYIRLNADPGNAVIGSKVAFLFLLQSYVLMLYSTLSRSQYDFTLPQVTFTSTGYHKHVTLTFNPTVRNSCFFFFYPRLNLQNISTRCFLWENIISFFLLRTKGFLTHSEAYCAGFASKQYWLGCFSWSCLISFLCVFVCAFPQRKVPDQDVAQGSYIALPLTLLLLLAAYNHEKVHDHPHLLQTNFSRSTIEFLNLFGWNKPRWNLGLSWPSLKFRITSRRMSVLLWFSCFIISSYSCINSC